MRDALQFDLALRRLQAELAVRWLAPTLAVLSVGLSFELSGRGRAVLVDVSAGEARAVCAVPIFFEKH
jgi:hypothetical protein